MSLLGRRAWYLPGFLHWLQRRSEESGGPLQGRLSGVHRPRARRV